jgi:hypothetical protein
MSTTPERQNMDEIVRLKKQVKILTISIITIAIATFRLALSTVAGLRSGEAWPDTTIGKLTVREVRIASPDGTTRAMLRPSENGFNLAFFDDKGELRILLSSSENGGYLSISGRNKSGEMLLTNTNLLMGDENKANLALVGPSAGGPRTILKDDNGYGLTLGRTDLLDVTSGDQGLTSAASIVATGKNSTIHWPLLKPQSIFTDGTKKGQRH